MKECLECKCRKPLDDFYNNRGLFPGTNTLRYPDGKDLKCKECRKQQKREEREERRQEQRKQLSKEQLDKLNYKEQRDKENSLVYVIKGYALYKIGQTTDFAGRWSSYITHSDITPQLIHLIKTPDHIELEKQLHTLYKSKRIRGEWFALSEEDIEYIRTL